jgi:hypothetical protein
MDKKKRMVEDVMSGTRQVSNKVGSNPSSGGKPGKGAAKHEGSKSAHSMMGLKMGSRVTSRETRTRGSAK